MKNYFLERYRRFGQDIDPKKIKLDSSIRINTLKIDEKKMISQLKSKVNIEKVPEIKNCYRIKKQNFSLASTQEYLHGYMYIQEVASQVSALALDPKPGDLVLDMCAAPGSKTTQLAQLMKNQGEIIALDIRTERLKALRNNLERCGVKNTITYNKDARYASDLNLQFDKILLDAPCSGNFATDPDWLEKRDPNDVTENTDIQKSLLKSAVNCLKPKGTLVYSTCSLEPEEDEFMIEWAIQNLKLKLEKIDIKLGSEGLTTIEKKQLSKEIAKTRRFWPNLTKTQGFYIAKLTKI